MNSVARFECLYEESDLFYDRKSGSIIAKNKIDNVDERMTQRSLCIYPWKILKSMKLPSVFFITFSFVSFTLFGIALILFFQNGKDCISNITMFPAFFLFHA